MDIFAGGTIWPPTWRSSLVRRAPPDTADRVRKPRLGTAEAVRRPRFVLLLDLQEGHLLDMHSMNR